MKLKSRILGLGVVLAAVSACQSSDGTPPQSAPAQQKQETQKSSVPQDPEKKIQAMLEKAKAKKLSDVEAPEAFLLGEQLAQQQRYAEADTLFSAVFEVQPSLTTAERLVQLRRLSGKITEALEAATRSKLLFGSSHLPRLWRHELLLLQGRTDEAKLELDEALQKFPQVPAVGVRHAETRMDAKDFAGAARELEALRKKFPDNPDVLSALVVCHLQLKDFDKAYEAGEAFSALSPGNPRMEKWLGDIAYAKGNLPAATLHYESAWKALPQSEPLAMLLGGVLARQKKWEDARRVLEKTVEIVRQQHPPEPELVLQLVEALMVLQDLPNARQRLVELEAQGVEKEKVLYLLGMCDLQASRYDDAVGWFERIPTKSPLSDESRRRIISIRLDQGRLADAKGLLNWYEHSSELSENNILFSISSWTRLKEWPRARALIEKGQKAKLRPEDLEYWQALVTWEENPKSTRGLELMEAFLKKNPRHAQGLNWLGYSLAEKGQRLPEAEAFIRRALDVDTGNGFYLDSLGWVLFRLGRLDEALQVLTESWGKVDDEPVVAEHLGEVYLKRGDKAKAREWFAKAEALYQAKPEGALLSNSEWMESRQRVKARLEELVRFATGSAPKN